MIEPSFLYLGARVQVLYYVLCWKAVFGLGTHLHPTTPWTWQSCSQSLPSPGFPQVLILLTNPIDEQLGKLCTNCQNLKPLLFFNTFYYITQERGLQVSMCIRLTINYFYFSYFIYLCIFQKMGEKCFSKCITKPGSSLDSSEQVSVVSFCIMQELKE